MFIASLQEDTRLADWQISQAERAVRLLRQFAGEQEVASSGMAPEEPSAIGNGNGLPQQSDPASRQPPTMAWQEAMAEERELLRLRHYSPKTEAAYLDWARRFAGYCRMRPPATVGEVEVKRYLSHLAIERKVAASTQNQAFNALWFLFQEVWGRSLNDLQETVRAKRGQRLPVVLSQEEVQRLFGAMAGTSKLMAQLTYGAGMRLMEFRQNRHRILSVL